MRRIFALYALLFVLGRSISYSQTGTDRERILNRRLEKIGFYHLGLGIDVAGYKNYMFAPKVQFGIGSVRHLYNVDFGLKFAINNPYKSPKKEYIRFYTMPLFLSGNLSIIRWKQNNAYVGAEISYNIALGSSHHVNDVTAESDSYSIAKNHLSWQGKLGFRNRNWDFCCFYEYDLSPALNQKYVYESLSYNYFEVYDSIFERWRIGFGVIYNFRF